MIVQVSDKEYTKYVVYDSWTMANSRLLLDLVQRFDRRFIVIQDVFTREYPNQVVFVTEEKRVN